MLRVFDFDIYTLLDLRVNLSFVIPYHTIKFVVTLNNFIEPFFVYTPNGDSVLAKKFYRSWPVL